MPAGETATPPRGEEPLSWLLLPATEPRTWRERRRFSAAARRDGPSRSISRPSGRPPRVEDRRLDEADDLRKCLAFDAVLGWRVFDIQRAAKAKPCRPALDFFDEDESAALYIGMEDCGFRNARAPPFDGCAIREAAVDVGRFVGFIPSRRQPLPGTEKSGTGMNCLLQATAIYRAIKKRGLLADLTMTQ